MKARREILDQEEAKQVWTGYLEAQVSWACPRSPDAILEELRGSPLYDDQPCRQL